VTWKEIEYVTFLQTMDIKANDALLLATFPFEFRLADAKNASDNVDKSVKIICGDV
jgi:hypothetical protein